MVKSLQGKRMAYSGSGKMRLICSVYGEGLVFGVSKEKRKHVKQTLMFLDIRVTKNKINKVTI